MPRTNNPTFKCRHVPRARNLKFSKSCRTIINNFYLGTSQFISINNSNINQYNFYKFDNETPVEKTTIKSVHYDETAPGGLRSDAPTQDARETLEKSYENDGKQERNSDGRQNTALVPSYNFEENGCDKNVSQIDTVKVRIENNTNLWSPETKYPVINITSRVRDKHHLSLLKKPIFLSGTDKNAMLPKHETKAAIDDVSKRLKRIVLQDTANLTRNTQIAVKDNPADLLCRFGKMIQINSCNHGNGKITKKFASRKVERGAKMSDCKYAAPSSGTSTPIFSKFLKKPSKQKNWGLSPIMSTRAKRDAPEIIDEDCKIECNKIECVGKLEYDDESEPQSNDDNSDENDDNSDDLFDLTNYLVTSGPRNTETHKFNSVDPPPVPLDTDEPQTTSFEDRMYRTTWSDSFNVNRSRYLADLNRKRHSKLAGRCVAGSNVLDATRNDQKPRYSSNIYKTAYKRLPTDKHRLNDSLSFSSDEQSSSTDNETNSSFESMDSKGKRTGNKSERYTKVIPGKRWRRSLLAAWNKRVTLAATKTELNTSKFNWNVRLSLNPQRMLDFDRSANKSRIVMSRAKSERYAQHEKEPLDESEYDSIVNDSVFEEAEMNAMEGDEELNRTVAIHQQVTIILQSDDTFFPDSVAGKVHARERVLELCYDNKLIDFDVYCDSLKKCKKIGEGIYGEVYKYVSRNEEVVLKVIPIEGERPMNLSPQKTYAEVLSEICVAMSLSGLKNFVGGNYTDGFCSILKIVCLRGAYPKKMMELWNTYDRTVGSENDSPEVFDSDQLYIGLEMLPAGEPLECYKFCSARQSYSVLLQVMYALAAAEQAFEFEHRDLHWGNVLVSATGNKTVEYVIDGEPYPVVTFGKKATIIDYTLSRIRSGKFDIYNDLETDQEIFQAYGDYQFDIYRDMRRDVNRQWASYAPKTNVRWIHYLATKCYDGVHYKTNHKTHQIYLRKIATLRDKMLNFTNAKDMVKTLILKHY